MPVPSCIGILRHLQPKEIVSQKHVLSLCLGIPSPSAVFGIGVLGLLDLEGWEGYLLALASGHGPPEKEVLGHVPGQQTNPRLDIVVQLQRDIFGMGNLARRMRDLVLGLLVFELELAATEPTG